MAVDRGTLYVYDPRSGQRRELQSEHIPGAGPNSPGGDWHYYSVLSNTADIWLIELPDDPQ